MICWFTATMQSADIMTIKIRYALPIIPILLTGTAYRLRKSLEKITLKSLCSQALRVIVKGRRVDIKAIIQGLLSEVRRWLNMMSG